MANGPTSDTPIFKHRGNRYPTVRSIMRLHEFILRESGGLPGVKNAGLLESAVRKVVESAWGREAYPTMFTKAAAVGFSIAQNHVFNDANKRTALETMKLILRLNGHTFTTETRAESTLMVLIATGHLSIDGVRVALIHWCGLNPGDGTL
jgi:death-on-curing protein